MPSLLHGVNMVTERARLAITANATNNCFFEHFNRDSLELIRIEIHIYETYNFSTLHSHFEQKRRTHEASREMICRMPFIRYAYINTLRKNPPPSFVLCKRSAYSAQ